MALLSLPLTFWTSLRRKGYVAVWKEVDAKSENVLEVREDKASLYGMNGIMHKRGKLTHNQTKHILSAFCTHGLARLVPGAPMRGSQKLWEILKVKDVPTRELPEVPPQRTKFDVLEARVRRLEANQKTNQKRLTERLFEIEAVLKNLPAPKS